MSITPTVPSEVPDPIDLGTRFRGDSFRLHVRCLWSDETPVDLTGATVWITFKADPSDADGVAPGFQRSTLSSGVTIAVPSVAGEVDIFVDGAATAAIEAPVEMTWDVQFRTASGETGTAAWGTIVFLADTTRATG